MDIRLATRAPIRTRIARTLALIFAAAVLLGFGLALNNRSLVVVPDFHYPVVHNTSSEVETTVEDPQAARDAEARRQAIALGLAVD